MLEDRASVSRRWVRVVDWRRGSRLLNSDERDSFLCNAFAEDDWAFCGLCGIISLSSCSSCDCVEVGKNGRPGKCSSPAAAWSNVFVCGTTRCTDEVVNARDVGEKITEARATDLAKDK